jgi:hypothetical protein
MPKTRMVGGSDSHRVPKNRMTSGFLCFPRWAKAQRGAMQDSGINPRFVQKQHLTHQF